jgi:hypothetical protein
MKTAITDLLGIDMPGSKIGMSMPSRSVIAVFIFASESVIGVTVPIIEGLI